MGNDYHLHKDWDTSRSFYVHACLLDRDQKLLNWELSRGSYKNFKSWRLPRVLFSFILVFFFFYPIAMSWRAGTKIAVNELLTTF